MDDTDRSILQATKDGIPLEEEPFRLVAGIVGIGTQELIDRLTQMEVDKSIRRFSAVIDQHKLGITANAVVAWQVPLDRVAEVATDLAESGEFSHCYERAVVPGVWEYNLYSVIHGRDRPSVEDRVKALSCKVGITEYEVFFSVRGFKPAWSGEEVSE